MQTPTDHATIIRVQKASNYSIISNHHLNDDGLSWKAKGLLTYLLSKPDNWQIRIRQLAKASTDGFDSVKSGIRELKQSGYITLGAIRDESGKFQRWEYTVFELPSLTTASTSPIKGKSRSGEPCTGKATRLLNTEAEKRLKKATTKPAAAFSVKSAEGKPVFSPKQDDIPEEITQALGSIPENERAFVKKSAIEYGADTVLKAVRYAMSKRPDNFYGYLRSCLASGYGSFPRPEKKPGCLREFISVRPENPAAPEEVKALLQEFRSKKTKAFCPGRVGFTGAVKIMEPPAAGTEAVKLLVESLKSAGRNLKEIASMIPDYHMPIFRACYGVSV